MATLLCERRVILYTPEDLTQQVQLARAQEEAAHRLFTRLLVSTVQDAYKVATGDADALMRREIYGYGRRRRSYAKKRARRTWLNAAFLRIGNWVDSRKFEIVCDHLGYEPDHVRRIVMEIMQRKTDTSRVGELLDALKKERKPIYDRTRESSDGSAEGTEKATGQKADTATQRTAAAG